MVQVSAAGDPWLARSKRSKLPRFGSKFELSLLVSPDWVDEKYHCLRQNRLKMFLKKGGGVDASVSN